MAVGLYVETDQVPESLNWGDKGGIDDGNGEAPNVQDFQRFFHLGQWYHALCSEDPILETSEQRKPSTCGVSPKCQFFERWESEGQRCSGVVRRRTVDAPGTKVGKVNQMVYRRVRQRDRGFALRK